MVDLTTWAREFPRFTSLFHLLCFSSFMLMSCVYLDRQCNVFLLCLSFSHYNLFQSYMHASTLFEF
jgi:hypothetical protein